MDCVSVRERLNSYVKDSIKGSGIRIILVFVLLSIGTTAIYKYVTHTTSKLKQNVELIDMMNFNQQIIEENKHQLLESDTIGKAQFIKDSIFDKIYNFDKDHYEEQERHFNSEE